MMADVCDLVSAKNDFDRLDSAVGSDASSAGATPGQRELLLSDPMEWLKHISFLVDDIEMQIQIKEDELNATERTPANRAEFLSWRARTVAFQRSLKRRRQVVLFMIRNGEST